MFFSLRLPCFLLFCSRVSLRVSVRFSYLFQGFFQDSLCFLFVLFKGFSQGFCKASLSF